MRARAAHPFFFGSLDDRSIVSRVMSMGIPGASLKVISGAGHLLNLEWPVEFDLALDESCARTQNSHDGRAAHGFGASPHA